MSARFNDKKRSAPDSRDRKPKSFNKGSNAPVKPGYAPVKKDFRPKSTNAKIRTERPEEIKRRKRPVTQGGGSDHEEEDEEAMDVDENDYIEVPADQEGGEPAEKKPRMTKAERAALHAAQPHRTALLPSHPLLQDKLLPLWETARRADLGKEERTKAVKELWEAARGRVAEISRGHKGGRVLQTIVKYGGKEERTGVAMELQPQWREMMESKYSKFLMAKLIRYCPSIRPLLIPSLASHLSSLLAHAHAVQPLSDFFDLWATSKERKMLVRGFYPKEVRVFDGVKETGEVKGLEGTLEALGDGKGRERVLDGLEKTVLDIFNATQKTALAQGIFHYLVREYLDCLYRFLPTEEADKKMHELLTASMESLAEIVHTKDGSAVVRQLIARGSAKDRKQILQHLRKHIEPMCKDADAQTVLFTAFDCVDDTKLMGKAFVSDIIGLAPGLVEDKNGRRVLLYLLTPTSTRHFLPSTLSTLATSAQLARTVGTSKKDPAIRRKELVGYASEGLIKLVADKGEELVRDPGAGLLVQEIMLYTEGDKSSAITALVAPLQTPYPEDIISEDEPHIIDLPHASRTYKLLLSGGHFDTKTKTVEQPDEGLSGAFSVAFWQAISSEEAGGAENVVRMAKGLPTFVLAEMVEGLSTAGRGKDVKAVLGKKDVLKDIAAGEKKGSGLLVDKINAL
ncbi:armadillo-type protein [Naematelia encephala]|uniref:Armadillo-type protein n=1 Tax=Naematelia encephala TaxID=71784 RepID=A0A1Y2BBP5_9TREE|nr:armadillo-type protein [Naematelia encephala]